MNWSLRKCVVCINGRATLAMICLFMGLCGIWALMGAGLIFIQDEPTIGSAAIGAVLVSYSLSCFAIVLGLWTIRPWARQAMVALSIAMLAADIAAASLQNAVLDARNLLLVFPLAFAGFVVWYFSKAEMRALYSRIRSSNVTSC